MVMSKGMGIRFIGSLSRSGRYPAQLPGEGRGAVAQVGVRVRAVIGDVRQPGPRPSPGRMLVFEGQASDDYRS